MAAPNIRTLRKTQSRSTSSRRTARTRGSANHERHTQGFESLGQIAGIPKGAGTEHIAIAREKKVDKFGRAYATGKRKNAVARVWVKPGKGNITINGKTSDAYFARPVLRMMINQPFKITEREGEFDVICTVVGSGLSGQAGACVTASRRRWPITSRRCVRR
jgi:hypothetical protein